MELLGFAAIAILAYIIFLGAKFTNFKSKLMNEFGRRGVPFAIADNIFFRERSEINDLFHSGMPIDQIVDRYIAREHSNEAPVTVVSANLTSKDEKPGKPSRQDKSKAIVKFVSNALGVQQALFLNEDGTLPPKAVDEWSIGYVAGTADAVLQKNGFEPDVEGMAVMTLIFMEVFGDRSGPELFGDFMRLQDQGNQIVEEGMMTGGRDVYAWMADTNRVPTGWMAYVHGLDTA